MIEGIILIATLGMLAAYFIGKLDSKEELQQVHKELVAERSRLAVVLGELNSTRKVQHNLNCLVGDLKFDLAEAHRCVRDNTADALAYKATKGLWCTDTPEILRNFPKKEYFRRIGYPEHKL